MKSKFERKYKHEQAWLINAALIVLPLGFFIIRLLG